MKISELRTVNKIKKILEETVYPPSYTPKKWKRKKVNCYAYALDIPVNDIGKNIWIPGCISGKNTEKVIWNYITEYVKKDLDFLGIKYRENDENLRKGEYRIAIYFRPSIHVCPLGFHLSRQDDDGIWSEKPSWDGKVHKIGEKSDTPPDLSEYDLYLENILILSK